MPISLVWCKYNTFTEHWIIGHMGEDLTFVYICYWSIDIHLFVYVYRTTNMMSGSIHSTHSYTSRVIPLSQPGKSHKTLKTTDSLLFVLGSSLSKPLTFRTAWHNYRYLSFYSWDTYWYRLSLVDKLTAHSSADRGNSI